MEVKKGLVHVTLITGEIYVSLLLDYLWIRPDFEYTVSDNHVLYSSGNFIFCLALLHPYFTAE